MSKEPVNLIASAVMERISQISLPIWSAQQPNAIRLPLVSFNPPQTASGACRRHNSVRSAKLSSYGQTLKTPQMPLTFILGINSENCYIFSSVNFYGVASNVSEDFSWRKSKKNLPFLLFNTQEACNLGFPQITEVLTLMIEIATNKVKASVAI